MINSDFKGNEAYSEYSKLLNEINVFDNFKISTKIKLIDCIKKINNQLINADLGAEEIQKIKNLRIQLLEKGSGGVLSNLFLTIFKKNEFRLLKSELHSMKMETKSIDKITSRGSSGSKFLSAYFGSFKKSLECLLFKEHLYEKMKLFGHDLKLNSEGKPIFKFSIRKSFQSIMSYEFFIRDPNKIEDWNGLKNEFIEKKIVLDIKGDFEHGRYQSVPITNEMPLEEFRNLIVQDGIFNPNITVVSSEDLPLDKLIKKGVIAKDKNNDFFIPVGFTYTENGFEKESKDWQELRPSHHIHHPPTEFTVDIIVHNKKGLPGVFDMGSHSSIKITTPGGEVYSVGFYPEKSFEDARLYKGSLRTPDEYQFIPTTSYEQHIMTYTLGKDSNKFHNLISWIEESHKQRAEEDNDKGLFPVLYHLSNHNCAFFAAAVRDRILQQGAKPQGLSHKKISNWTRAGIRVKESLLNFLLKNPLGKIISNWGRGIEHAGMKKYTITHVKGQKFYLPIDLLLDYQKTAGKIDNAINQY